MAPGSRWAAAAAIAFVLGGAPAASARTFKIPPGPLGDVAAALGIQAGVTIAITEPDLAARRSGGVTGDLSVRAALAQALRDTGAQAVFLDGATVRIVRMRAAAPPRSRPATPETPATSAGLGEIVVTASKQNIVLQNYPGSAKVVEFDRSWLARYAAHGTAAITETLPTLSTTNLGRGRNKIFIRGVADSSFNGPTQATVGQYLGDVRLNYNAPDPDLNLYDLKRVEVLTGPQGTLYGASSLGGIMRLVPNAPDSAGAYATASTGLSTTRFGGLGYDGAAMINLPLGDGRAAVRLVAYGARDAGYIDAPLRGLKDVNRGRAYGQRLMWRMDDLGDWTVNLGAVFQSIASKDGQYTRRGDPPLVRSNALAQPFRNDFRLAYVTGRRPFGSRDLLTTTSIAGHELTSVFDATGSDGSTSPRLFAETNDILLVSHETRLAGGDRNAPWVVGLTGVYNVSRLSRSLGPTDAPKPIAGVRNSQLELSVFGQASRALGPSVTLTAGGRLTAAGSNGQLFDRPAKTPEAESRRHVRFVPMAALDWRLTSSLSTYLQYQQGFRAGGLAIAPNEAATASQEFVADDLAQIELGVRWRNPLRDRLSARAAVFAVDWNHVQADLVDDAGLPYTANIGSGRIAGLDAEASWRPSPEATVTVSAFFNDTYLYGRPAGSPVTGKRTLPNIPRDGVRIETQWRRELTRDVSLTADASVRYVGKSYLGAGSSFDVSQGNYVVGGLGARLDFERFGVSLDLSNITDARANTFAFGNPFGLTRGDQITPLRPRTVRVGLDARF